MTRFPSVAPLILRLGLTVVFVWFGVSQIVNTEAWTGFVPANVINISGISASTLVRMNGIFEVIAGLLLACGVYVRWVAFALALHLFGITTSLGMTAIGVRDFGLSCATLALALFGDDEYCLTRK